MFVNPTESYPRGGGRPINGGVNTGGGIVVISSHAMKTKPNFQSTLQHELGHAFGLTHVNVYGYDMGSSDSIMSYNPGHHTRGLKPSKTPGILIPEDLRGLALNNRAFVDLEFDESEQVPKNYKLGKIKHLGPMKLSDHPLIVVETNDGEAYSSSVQNIVHSRIRRSIRRGDLSS